MKRTFKVMDHTGDTEHKFDAHQSAEAETLFNQLLKGRVAYKNDGAGAQTHVSKFADTNEETIFAPQLQGG